MDKEAITITDKSNTSPYYINGIYLRPSDPTREYSLLPASAAFRMCHSLAKVLIPNDVLKSEFFDKQYKTPWWVLTAKSDLMIAECNPIVLCYVYGEWRHVLDFHDIINDDIAQTMSLKGYEFDQHLGYMSVKNIEHYHKTRKMLFG